MVYASGSTVMAIVFVIAVGMTLQGYAGLHTIVSSLNLLNRLRASPYPLEAVEATGANRLQRLFTHPQIVPPYISLHHVPLGHHRMSTIGFVEAGDRFLLQKTSTWLTTGLPALKCWRSLL
jgi:ABC-type phosphate/phosphonate transport system permease subunit